jgi:hypothetical protein
MLYKIFYIYPGAALLHKLVYSWLRTSSSMPRLHGFAIARKEGIYRPRSGVHRPNPSTVQADNHQRKGTK